MFPILIKIKIQAMIYFLFLSFQFVLIQLYLFYFLNQYSKSNIQIQIQTIIKMRTSKVQKSERIPSHKNIIPHTPTIKFSYHNYTNLTNQQYLIHSLKLLGVTQSDYLKETKLSMNDEIFAKHQTAASTKQFFYILVTCLKFLTNQQEFNTIKIWYPPRTVNEQLELKKAAYNIFAKLQTKNKIPKKLLISKNFLMAQTPAPKIIQFLRILAELALRSSYLRKFSKKQRLVDILFTQTQNAQKQPNDINQFYFYPFTPSQGVSNPLLDKNEIQSLKNIYKAHIEIYRKKILALSNKYPKQQLISCQQLMADLVEQKQLSEKLNKKIPKNVLSDNRAFDRRKIIDISRHTWESLNKISCYHVQKSQTTPVLKYEGEIDKILQKWETPTGINKMLDICKMAQKLGKLKQRCKLKTKQFTQFNEKLNNELKKYDNYLR